MSSKSAVSTFDLSDSRTDAWCLMECHAALNLDVISSASGMLSFLEKNVATSLSLAKLDEEQAQRFRSDSLGMGTVGKKSFAVDATGRRRRASTLRRYTM